MDELKRPLENENLKSFIYVFLCTIGLGFLIHGYGFFNMIYSMDSMLVYQNDVDFQLGLGRFMLPVYVWIRGGYYPPAVIGALSLTYVAVATYLILKLFDITDRFIIFFICAIMTTNSLVIFLVSDFICYMDVQLLGLMLMVIGVYLYRRYKFGFLALVPLCVASLGLYQAYFQVGVTLFVALAIYELYLNKKASEVVKRFVIQMLVMGLSMVIYLFTSEVVNRLKGVETSDGFNAIGAAYNFRGFRTYLKLFWGMYEDTFINIIDQRGNFKYLKGAGIAVMLIVALILLIRRVISSNIEKMNKILICLCLLILPSAMTCIYFFSGGYYHTLMRFSHYIVYSLALALIGKWCSKETIKRIVYGILVFFIIDNMVAAGNQYLQKDMIYQSTMFNMTRIIDRLEQTEGYEPGKPVVFSGDIERSSMNYVRPDYFRMSGTHYYTSVCYYRLYERFFQQLLGYPIWIMTREEAVEVEKNPEIDKMGVFPAKDSIKEIDGIFVVKVSDVKLEIYGEPKEE